MARHYFWSATALLSLMNTAYFTASSNTSQDSSDDFDIHSSADQMNSKVLERCEYRLSERTDFDLIDIEEQILEHLNDERRFHNLPELVAVNPCLELAALAHSENMADQGKLDHTLDNLSPFQRLSNLEVPYSRAAENIYMRMASWKGNPLQDNAVLAESAHNAWKNSSGHYKNMMNPHYDEIGIGVAWRYDNGSTYLYATQVFLQKKNTPNK